MLSRSRKSTAQSKDLAFHCRLHRRRKASSLRCSQNACRRQLQLAAVLGSFDSVSSSRKRDKLTPLRMTGVECSAAKAASLNKTLAIRLKPYPDTDQRPRAKKCSAEALPHPEGLGGEFRGIPPRASSQILITLGLNQGNLLWERPSRENICGRERPAEAATRFGMRPIGDCKTACLTGGKQPCEFIMYSR